MNIIKIENEIIKSNLTNKILNQLNDWFGISEAIIEFEENVKNKPFFAVYDDINPIGFISIKHNNPYTAEIYVMGILKKYHRQGIGSMLVHNVESLLRKQGYRFLMVKTLGPSNDDESYKKTRLFYENIGFYPLEELKEIWDENNPCLILIKNI